MRKIRNKKIVEHLGQLTDLCLNPSADINKILSDSAFKVNIREGKGVFLNEEEGKLFDKIIDGLLAEQISEYASKDFLKDSLWNHLFEIFENPEEFKREKEKKMQEFLKDLSRPFYDWVVVFPLNDLKCTFKLPPIGDVRFFTFTDAEKSKWNILKVPDLKTLKTIFKRTVEKTKRQINFETFKESYVKRVDRIVPYFKEKICAEVKVKAIDSTKAIEKGKYEVDTALNLIRSSYGIRGPKAAIEIKEPLNAITKNLNTGAEDLKLERDWFWGSTINFEDREKLSNYIQHFDSILMKTQKTRLDKRVVRSIRWCGEAIKDKNLEDKILKYFTALECLLVPEEEGLKGDVLGERISVIWTSSKKIRELIKQDIIELYEKRSDIAHGSKYRISQRDVNKLDFVTRNIIAQISKIITERSFTKMGQLISWIKCQ